MFVTLIIVTWVRGGFNSLSLCRSWHLFILFYLFLSFFLIQLHCRGVRAISSSANGSSIYTAGADGMVCVIDFMSGNLLEKFKASTKAVSCMSVSSGMYPWQLLMKSLFLVEGNVVNAFVVLILAESIHIYIICCMIQLRSPRIFSTLLCTGVDDIVLDRKLIFVVVRFNNQNLIMGSSRLKLSHFCYY